MLVWKYLFCCFSILEKECASGLGTALVLLDPAGLRLDSDGLEEAMWCSPRPRLRRPPRPRLRIGPRPRLRLRPCRCLQFAFAVVVFVVMQT